MREFPHPPPPLAAYLAGNLAPRCAAHTVKIGLTSLPGRLLCGSPRTLPRRARCFFLYRPSGPDGTTHFPGNLALCHAHHAAKIGLAGFPAALTPQESPPPPVPQTLLFFFIGPSGPSGGGHFAGNPVPCPSANAAKIGQRACRHLLLRGNPRTLPPPLTPFFLYCPWRSSPCNLLAGLARRLAFVSFSIVAVLAIPVWRKGPRPTFMAALAAAGKIL